MNMLRPFCLIVAAAVAAPAQKQAPPPPGPLRPFQFPKWETRKLANGLTVFVIEDHRLPMVSCQLEILAGSSAHDLSRAGLAWLTAQLLRQGTGTRSAQDIARAVDSVGGNLSATANQDTAAISAGFTRSHSLLGMELMADIVLNPAFQQAEIDRLVRRSLSNLQVDYNDPEALLPLVRAREVYGGHPYANPVEGTPDTLKRLKRDDIVAFHRARYAPANAFLAISGDITPAEAAARAERYFGGWKTAAPARAALPAPAAAERRVLIIDKPDAVQTQYAITQIALPRNHPDYLPFLIANQSFGGNFNSRLNLRLRANEGLTYGASSVLGALREAGSFTAQSYTRTEKTVAAIRIMTDLLKEFREKPVTEAEINEAKAFLTGSFVIGVETAGQVAQRVLASAVNGLPEDYWATYRDKIQATTIEQVEAAVRRHLTPDKMRVVIVGAASRLAGELEALGPVEIIPLADIDLASPNLRRAKAAPPAADAASRVRAIGLIQAAVKAVGGQDALAAVKDLVSKATVRITTPPAEMAGETREEVVYPDKYKLTLTLPVATVVQAYDGKSGWMQHRGESDEIPAAGLSEFPRAIAMAGGLGLLRDALDGKAEVALLDPFELDGRKMDAVAWKSGESTVRILFDPDTHRIAKLTYRGGPMSGPGETDAVWSEYRELNGLQFPTREAIYRNGQKFIERNFTERTVNGGLKPEVFIRP